MRFEDTHEFQTRNMNVCGPEGKLVKDANGSFTVETKNGLMLFEYRVDYRSEQYDYEALCSYYDGTVAYGIISDGDFTFLDEIDFRSYATGPEGVKYDVWEEVASNVLWFSRHEMTIEQMDELVGIYGPVNVHKIDKQIKTASELKTEIYASDIVAVVAPIELQADFVKESDGTPVISCRTKRILTQEKDGTEVKTGFVFDGWYEIKKIEIITEDL